MNKKYFLYLISITILTCWDALALTEQVVIQDVGVIGPKAKVILFYKENNNIVVKQCEDYTVLKLRSDCKVKLGTVVKNVPVSDFKSSLKMALKLPGGNYDPDMKKEIELYNGNQKGEFEKLTKRQKELKDQIARVEAFIEEFGSENANANDLFNLQVNLSQVEEKLDNYAQVDEAIEKINENIDNLVDNILSNDTFLYGYTFSEKKTSFIFNILNAYLRIPMISTSFQRITKGSFTMGSPSSENKRSSDEGQKEVTISKSFDIMTKEVTQAQWFLVMGTNPSRFKKPEYCDNHININGEGLCPSNPVEQVSWKDVQTYIKKLNDSLQLSGCNGTPSDSKGCYRLPTEAEWEFAARGKTTTAYSFGDSSLSLGNYAWYKNNSDGKTHPVGLKKANPYGLYDIHGNVWEWVQDRYADTLEGGFDPLNDNSEQDEDYWCVIRGGSRYDNAQKLRTTHRLRQKSSSISSTVGFRLVRTL